MESELIDDTTIRSAKESTLFSALKWWESKRYVFNLIVGITGLTSLLAFASGFNNGELIGIFIYAFILNLCYSVGFLLESLNLFYLTESINLAKFRLAFFILGTILSAFVTFIIAMFYSAGL